MPKFKTASFHNNCSGTTTTTFIVIAAAALVLFAVAVDNKHGHWMELKRHGKEFWLLLRAPHMGVHSKCAPPPSFPQLDEWRAKWRAYAQARECSTEESDYSQIFEDLNQFLCAGGISPASVDAAYEQLRGYANVLVTAGEHVAGGLQFDNHFSEQPHEPFWAELMRDYASELPNVKMVFSMWDEPLSWTADLPADVEAALQNGSLSLADAWASHSCNSVPELEAIQHLHGHLASSTSMGLRKRGLLPVFSRFKIDGCLGDILIPGALNNPDDWNAKALGSGCPINTGDWSEKVPKAIWRGATTGTVINDETPAEAWQMYHRQRLVQYSLEHPEHLDAGFTGYIQCSPKQCAAMHAKYGMKNNMGADLFNYKYQMVVDGNGAPTRVHPTLCSGSLMFLSTIFKEWFYYKLVPYRHYVPIKHDYSDLVEKVEWARQNDTEARAMVAAATELVNSHLRMDDAKCYMYRLLVEYAGFYHNETFSVTSLPPS